MNEIEKAVDEWADSIVDEDGKIYSIHSVTLKEQLNKVAIPKDVLWEKIDTFDIEFGIATHIIEKETGKKVDIPEELEELMDRYWRYIFSRLREDLLREKRGGEDE